jgi:hypothetical protein
MSEQQESAAIIALCAAILLAATVYVFVAEGVLGTLWIAAVTVGYLVWNQSNRRGIPRDSATAPSDRRR